MDRRGRRRGPFVRAMMAVVVMLALCGLAPAQATAASPAWIRQLGTPGDDGGYVATPAPGGGIYLVAGWNTDLHGLAAIRTEIHAGHCGECGRGSGIVLALPTASWRNW